MREFVAVYLKGFAMGSADVVPGVSGGTIALIVGIYDRLIGAITALDPREFGSLRRVHTADGRAALSETLERMDVGFLLTLGLGIATAIVTLSRVMHHATVTYPVATYGFFFGLIVAAAIVLYRQVEVYSWRRVRKGARGGGTDGLALPVPNQRFPITIVGVAIAFGLAGLTRGSGPQATWFVFLAGAIAVSAMILPGVSGALFLVLLGQYEYITGTLSNFIEGILGLAGGGSLQPVIEYGTVVVVFCLGAAVGLFSMAHVLHRALERYRQATLAFLVSLMVGALRVPYDSVVEALGTTPLGTLEVALLAGLLGALAVLVLDHYTDGIEYDGDERPNPV